MPTHFSSLQGQVRTSSGINGVGQPSDASTGDVWFDSEHNALMVYDGSAWRGRTMTSTSTSTTTTSSSTTTS